MTVSSVAHGLATRPNVGRSTPHPDRLAGSAAPPTQDPKGGRPRARARRGGFGAQRGLVNAYPVRDLEDPDFRSSGSMCPGNSVDSAYVPSGCPELVGPMRSWGDDTESYILRLTLCGACSPAGTGTNAPAKTLPSESPSPVHPTQSLHQVTAMHRLCYALWRTRFCSALTTRSKTRTRRRNSSGPLPSVKLTGGEDCPR